ncbi:hypothetical protein X777_08213 [Ooceraea biroi]|uniref:Uncharacterized protein n=1 Tax=Ooceraea biroi TaxID=2015173 RepID=A0A026WZ26_OOCBI|nr:hypothetical protein X777_08213 [Ooceraea biroi]
MSSGENSRVTIADYSYLAVLDLRWENRRRSHDGVETRRRSGSCVRTYFSGDLRERENNTKEPRVSMNGREQRPTKSSPRLRAIG